MSLETKRAAFNAAITAAVLAWDDLIDGCSAGDRILVTPVQGNRNGTAMAETSDPPGLATTDNAKYMTKLTYIVPATSSSSTSMLYSINCEGLLPYYPLFWKITNDAGELA